MLINKLFQINTFHIIFKWIKKKVIISMTCKNIAYDIICYNFLKNKTAGSLIILGKQICLMILCRFRYISKVGYIWPNAQYHIIRKNSTHDESWWET